MELNVLIIEDEKEFLETLLKIVEVVFKKDFPDITLFLHQAYNGEEGLSKAKELKPDIIITDITMPVMDGKEMISKIREFDHFVPILALTALTDSKDVDDILKSGASNYTSKPLNKNLFIAQIRTFTTIVLNRQFIYNKHAVNIITNKIYKRKTIFAIEKEDDFIEFWDYIVEYIPENESILKLLKLLYKIESLLFKTRVENGLVLEENDEYYFFTVEEIQHIKKEALEKIVETDENIEVKIDDSYHKLTFKLKKVVEIEENETESQEEEEDTTKQKLLDLKKINEEICGDIRYTIHEQVTADELLSELDPTIWDKIENFDEDLEIFRIKLYNLEDAKTIEEIKINMNYIIESLEDFIEIVDKIGFFSIICRSFSSLITFLQNLDLNMLQDTEKRILLAMSLRALADDLDKWIIHLFFENSATDIHYFDASFAENIIEIEKIILGVDDDGLNDDDGDLEFF